MTNLIDHLKAEFSGNRCKHPVCSCRVAEGESYCSAECEGMSKTPDINCLCGHPECKGQIE